MVELLLLTHWEPNESRSTVCNNFKMTHYFVPAQPSQHAFWKKMWGVYAHTWACEPLLVLMPSQSLAHRVSPSATRRCLVHSVHSDGIVYIQTSDRRKKKHTQSERAVDDQQFRVVLIRWEGSEKKKRSLPSSAYTFRTLYSNFAFTSWTLTKRRLMDAPSKVTPRT